MQHELSWHEEPSAVVFQVFPFQANTRRLDTKYLVVKRQLTDGATNFLLVVQIDENVSKIANILLVDQIPNLNFHISALIDESNVFGRISICSFTLCVSKL